MDINNLNQNAGIQHFFYVSPCLPAHDFLYE